MKTIIKIICTCFIFAVLLSCRNTVNSNTANNNSNHNNNEKINKLIFDNFENYSILVKNNTAERLAAFKGEISISNLISGVPSFASNHGLRIEIIEKGKIDFNEIF